MLRIVLQTYATGQHTAANHLKFGNRTHVSFTPRFFLGNRTASLRSSFITVQNLKQSVLGFVLSGETICHIWPFLRSLALDVSSRHAYAGNLPRKYGSNLTNQSTESFTRWWNEQHDISLARAIRLDFEKSFYCLLYLVLGEERCSQYRWGKIKHLFEILYKRPENWYKIGGMKSNA